MKIQTRAKSMHEINLKQRSHQNDNHINIFYWKVLGFAAVAPEPTDKNVVI